MKQKYRKIRLEQMIHLAINIFISISINYQDLLCFVDCNKYKHHSICSVIDLYHKGYGLDLAIYLFFAYCQMCPNYYPNSNKIK